MFSAEKVAKDELNRQLQLDLRDLRQKLKAQEESNGVQREQIAQFTRQISQVEQAYHKDCSEQDRQIASLSDELKRSQAEAGELRK